MVKMSSLFPEPESSRMTTSRNFQSPKNSGPSFLGLRSPLSSLFSFRKSAKQTLKPPSQQERHGIFSVSGQIPPNTNVDRKFEIYHSTRSVKQIASFFEEQHNRARENVTTKATNQLEREAFQVLGDLDQKLAQEQSHIRTPRISRLANYTYGRQYSKEGSLHNTAEPKNVYSHLPSHDGRRSGPPEGTHTTYATYQPRKFYEMYSNRQRQVSKPEASNKPSYNKSPSLFSAVSNITPKSSPASGSFSTSSLQLSSPGLHLERIRQNKSRRTPVTSIKWNNSFPSGHPEGIGRPFRTQSTLDLTNLDKSNTLYKYNNVPGLPVSTSNDLHEFRNIKNLTNTSCMNIVDNKSTGYYIADSPSHSPEVKFSTQPERHWEEKNYFNKNEVSSAPNGNSGSSDMETEPMELESDLSVQPDASSVANEEPSIHERDIPVDCTFHNREPLEVSSNNTSEPENMDIDASNVFLNSKNSGTSTVGLGPSAQEDHVPLKTEAPGLALTDRNQSLDTIKKFSSFDHGTPYKIDTSFFTNPKSSELSDQVNKLDHKSSSLSGNTTDVGGRFAWMNIRRESNNHAEGFRSDALKFQKRNASSLPDLLDEDSETVANDSDFTLHKRSCENVLECGATTVPATQSSSRISNDSNELHFQNNSKYEQPCVQNMIPQKPKSLSTKNDQSLQKPDMFLYQSVVDGAFRNQDRTATYPAVPYEAESLTEKYNHADFLSDTLKYKKRNASSLPDLLDQESDTFGKDPENILRNLGCGHDRDYHTSTVLKTSSSMIPDERKERYLERSTRYEQSGVQDTNQQPKISTSSTWQSIQRVSPFSRGSELDCSSIQTEKTTAESEVAYPADTKKENNKVKSFLHLTETTPFSHVYAKYKSVNFRGQYNGSDSNNNTQLTGGIQTSDILNKDKSRIERGYIHQKQDHPEKQQVKSSKSDTSFKLNLSAIYQKDVASSPNQKNTDQDRQVEQGSESEGNLNQILIYQLDQEANNKAEHTDPPKIRDSSRFPVSQSVKECSEEDNFRRATHLHNAESKSTNLLKQHLFVAPEPFKGNLRVSVIPKSEWKNSTSSENSQSPTHLEGENIEDLDSEYKASQEGLQPHKTYTCQQIVENTEIYESLTDTSYPEVDKIEYRKVVSVYYSLPRKFARRISDLSKNNLKNIDKTLQQSRAPSALLDIIGRCHKEEPDFNLQNSENIKTSITETVHSVEDVASKTHHLNFHFIPLQTNLLKNGSRTNSGEKNDDLVNKFSSLHISENEDNHTAHEDPKNKNEYSPSKSSPRYSPNSCYFTLPNKKSSLQDLERNVLERDIAMAWDRFNIYPGSRNMEPSPPEFQDVFASPTACYDNLNYSPGYDFMHFQESNKQEYNINNIFARDGGLYKKNSMDEGITLREDLPSIYKSKSYKDVSQSKLYNTEDISPHTDCDTSPQTDYYHPVFSQNSSVINQTRPSYCSEFVQKKMKPINAKKFSFSVDHSSQESVSPRQTGSYDDTVRLSDGNSPSVFHSPNNNYPSHADKYFGQTKPKDGGNSNLYRSKSMKLLNTEDQQNVVDYKRKSDSSFSSKSYGGTLRSKSPSGKTWNRTSSAEILGENDNWPINDERKAVCTSKSVDYGIFGKEQQEAIVNNVKRSLTEGRLWRPSFLKNPGFLRTEELSSQVINPVGQTPGDSSSQRPNVKESLNIYEDVPVVPSDSDTETTTDDEYYLDEYYLNDKESEL